MNDSRLPERFWSKVNESPTGCWIWTAAHTADGYANLKVDGKAIRAHRFAYQALVGSIPDGLDIDHLCRVRDCVNPCHMQPVTRRVNTLRGVGWTAQQAAKTHCIRGHEFNDQNTYLVRGRNRSCRKCNALSQRKVALKKKSVLS